MQNICKKKLKLIIVGTAVSGKSRLSVSLARHFSWQIVNTDPAWFFKKADILTNKVTPGEQKDVPHFCVDFLELGNRGYQMRQFEAKVDGIVKEQFSEKDGILLVGGSNFYNEKVIFQQRARIIQEEKQDYYERLKHNITLILNEILFDENLKKIGENLDLDLHFQKLLKKETAIEHSCLQSGPNKLKYLLLNAPQKFLDCLFEQFELKMIYALVRRLFPFRSSAINESDEAKIRQTLLKFVSGKPKNVTQKIDTKSKMETLNKGKEEEMLVVILYNSDTALAQRLIRGRIAKMIFKKEGIKEFFEVFESLLVRPESIYNIIEKYLLTCSQLKCTVDEIILVSLKDVKDSIKINKANRYGVLSVKGYKEFFNFFEKFIFVLINNFFRITLKNQTKVKEMAKDELKRNFVKYYFHLRDSLIQDFRATLPEVFKQHGQINKGDPNFLIKRVFLECLYSLENETFMLYKKQRTWLQKRIVENNLLKNHIFVKEVKDYHLKDNTFQSEVIEPVIQRIKEITGQTPEPSAKFQGFEESTNKAFTSNMRPETHAKENLRKRSNGALAIPKEEASIGLRLEVKRLKCDL
jgi:tRNA A37 N6-isopentenylltransferase MiaA